jgi:hypothetical protein
VSDTELLIKEIKALPPNYVARILDFVALLKKDASLNKASLVLSPAYSSEDALRISAERSAARRADPSLNTIGKYKGCLKGSLNFDCDGMAIQREMRNEWG